MKTSAVMRTSQVLLLGVGVIMLAFGIVTVLRLLPLGDLIWLAVWLGAAVIIHDGILVPAIVLMRSKFRRSVRRWPRMLGVVIEVAFAAVAVLTLFVLPELWAQYRGSPNPTLLTNNYALNLAVAWGVALFIVLVAAWVITRQARRISASDAHHRGDATHGV